jgi:hypothetical protein
VKTAVTTITGKEIESRSTEQDVQDRIVEKGQAGHDR